MEENEEYGSEEEFRDQILEDLLEKAWKQKNDEKEEVQETRKPKREGLPLYISCQEGNVRYTLPQSWSNKAKSWESESDKCEETPEQDQLGNGDKLYRKEEEKLDVYSEQEQQDMRKGILKEIERLRKEENKNDYVQ